MAIKLPLDTMTVEEKLAVIEEIWQSLDPQDVEPPAWHGEVLAERAAAVERGEDKFVDWETAKENIRKKIR